MQIDKGSAHLKKSLLPETQEKRRFFLEGSLERCKNFLPFLSGLGVGWLTALAVWRIYQHYSAKKGLSLAKWVAYGVKNFFSFSEKRQAEGFPTAKREQEIKDSLWFLEEKLRREFSQKSRRDEAKNKAMEVKNPSQSVSERVGEAFRAEEALSEHSAKAAEKEIQEDEDATPQNPSLKKSVSAPAESSKNGTKKAPAKSTAKTPAKKTAKTAAAKKSNAGTAKSSTAKKVSKKTSKNGKSAKKT